MRQLGRREAKCCTSNLNLRTPRAMTVRPLAATVRRLEQRVSERRGAEALLDALVLSNSEGACA